MKKFKYDFNICDFTFLIFVFVKMGVFKSLLLEYASLFSFIFLIFLKSIKNKTFKISIHTFAYLLFVIFACISYFWALNKNFALEYISSIVALFALILSINNYIKTEKDILKIIKFLVLASVIVSLKIILLYFFIDGTAAIKIKTITGIYFNTVGQTIGYSTIFTLLLYYYYHDKRFIICLLPQYIAILLTESRKSLLIPIISIIIIKLIEKKDAKKVIKYFFEIILLLIFVYFVSLLNISIISNIKREMINLFSSFLGNHTDDWSVNQRAFFIKTGLHIFKKHPLIGIGLNNFAYYTSHYTYSIYTSERYAHNNYIEILSCLGIIGFMLYYWIQVYIISKLYKLIKLYNNKSHIIAFSFLATLLIMDYGVVSYSGCIYHLYITLSFYIGYYYKWFKKGENL